MNLEQEQKQGFIWGPVFMCFIQKVYEVSSGSLQVIRQSIQKVPEIKACSIWDV